MTERSDGLPLLIEELVSRLIDSPSLVYDDGAWSVVGELSVDLPHTLVDLVQRRLAGVPAQVRPVVDAAAVIGGEVAWTLLEPVTGLSASMVTTGLRAAVNAHLLEADDVCGRLRWRHMAIRDAVLSQLLPPEVAGYAVRAAEVLERRDPQLTGPDGLLAAELYVRGGRADHAAGMLLTLGRRASARCALKTADDLLRRAAELGADAAVIERVSVLGLAGRVDDALAVGEAALPSSTGDGHAELCLQLARAAVLSGQWNRALDYAARAHRPDDPRIEAVAADAAFGAGRIAEAARRAERAVGMAEQSGMPEVVCRALEVVGRCAQLRDPAIAEAAYRRAARVAEEHGLVAAHVSATLAFTMVQLLERNVAAPRLPQVRDLAVDASMLATVASIDLLMADWQALITGPAGALELAQRSAEQAKRLHLAWLQAMALLWVASGHAEAGRVREGNACVARAVELAPDSPDVIALSSCIRALPALLDHD